MKGVNNSLQLSFAFGELSTSEPVKNMGKHY